MDNIFEKLNLQLFAEGGDGGEGAADAGVNNAQEAAAPVNRRARRVNPMANITFGVDPNAGQAAADTTEGTQTQEQTAEPTFDELIGKGGKHEKDFNKAVQKILQPRLKKNQDRLNSYEPIMQLLGQRYNIAAGEEGIDAGALMTALEDDRKYYEDRAYREGVTPETLMMQDKLKRQQEMINARQQAEQQEAQTRSRYMALQQQAVELQASMPGFDLETEMQNPRFMRMVMGNVPVKDAYFALHHEEIMAAQRQQQMAAANTAVQQARQMTANAIAAGQMRPVENGNAGNAPAQHITSPKNLTKQMREEVRRRVKNGEKIYW